MQPYDVCHTCVWYRKVLSISLFPVKQDRKHEDLPPIQRSTFIIAQAGRLTFRQGGVFDETRICSDAFLIWIELEAFGTGIICH